MGYYVNNEYTEEALANEPPAKPIIEKVRRVILAEKPRVTRFGIKWDSEESAPAEFPPDQPEADAAEDDENKYAEEEELEGDDAAEEAPELVEGDEKAAVAAEGEEAEVEGAAEKKVEDDAASDAGSEDLEAESSGSEEEEDEEEEGEGEQADEDVEMADGTAAAPTKPDGKENVKQEANDVMVQ